jgi:hypothetical protein
MPIGLCSFVPCIPACNYNTSGKQGVFYIPKMIENVGAAALLHAASIFMCAHPESYYECIVQFS